jgi:hypothetical protein
MDVLTVRTHGDRAGSLERPPVRCVTVRAGSADTTLRTRELDRPWSGRPPRSGLHGAEAGRDCSMSERSFRAPPPNHLLVLAAGLPFLAPIRARLRRSCDAVGRSRPRRPGRRASRCSSGAVGPQENVPGRARAQNGHTRARPQARGPKAFSRPFPGRGDGMVEKPRDQKLDGHPDVACLDVVGAGARTALFPDVSACYLSVPAGLKPSTKPGLQGGTARILGPRPSARRRGGEKKRPRTCRRGPCGAAKSLASDRAVSTKCPAG